ncbi:hypothetical protein [Paraburkholderia adhaesiva]|uniref:hypothetical protein n=1 Tax=Paraburkholderia adhaesiva TaxID=2883244 RepID=UPI001F34B7C6|nr:hypothetical protein [Paraburkholderia adhaesiva]
MSTEIAARVHGLGLVADDDLRTMLTVGCRLDYRTPAARTLHDDCMALLRDGPSG